MVGYVRSLDEGGRVDVFVEGDSGDLEDLEDLVAWWRVAVFGCGSLWVVGIRFWA